MPIDADDPHYAALATWIAARTRPGKTLIIGINGTQASGKSTLAALLVKLLARDYTLRAVTISIDDFYRTRAEREALARDVHPLLITRGVPGTHDVELASRTFDRIGALRANDELSLPRFIKVLDDRAPEKDWPTCIGPIDVLLFDGWCVGTPPQAAEDLVAPVNALEAQEDPDGRWRAFVNTQLKSDYAALFARLDALVFLQAPGFDVVHGWRLEQEAGNVREVADPKHALTADSLRRFIAHYERLTRHALRVLPDRADFVLELDAQRRIVRSRQS
jgi:D-glycerate 3-kinase